MKLTKPCLNYSKELVCLGEFFFFFKQRLGTNYLKTVTGMIDTLAAANCNEKIGNLRTSYAAMWSTYLTSYLNVSFLLA